MTSTAEPGRIAKASRSFRSRLTATTSSFFRACLLCLATVSFDKKQERIKTLLTASAMPPVTVMLSSTLLSGSTLAPFHSKSAKRQVLLPISLTVVGKVPLKRTIHLNQRLESIFTATPVAIAKRFATFAIFACFLAQFAKQSRNAIISLRKKALTFGIFLQKIIPCFLS